MNTIKCYIEKNKLKITLYSSLTITLLIACLSFFIISNKYQMTENEDQINILSEKNEDINKSETKPKTIKVDIKGKIKNPGVYEMLQGSRVIDLIELSGGLVEDSYITCLNLSKILEDEDVIIIDNKKEIISTDITKTCTQISNGNTNNDSSNAFVNINEATKDQLMSLNGIGESKAINIIEYRTTNGKFKSKEELKNVKGIGESIYEKIKDNIRI